MQIIAHRGLLRHAPENTVAALRSCLLLRLGFEFDVQRTSDGKLVCIHDTTLDRTTNGKGKVSDHTWAALQTLDAGGWFSAVFRGERILSIDDVFRLIAKHKYAPGPFAVDVKLVDKTVERDLVRLANKHKVLARLMFIGRTIESAEMRKRFKTADRNAIVARLANSPAELKDAIADAAVDWVYVRFIPTKAQVNAIHAVKKKVILVGSKVAGNEPANWKAGIANGVDAILTDYPLRLRTVDRGKRR